MSRLVIWGDPCQYVDSFLINFDLVLISQLAHVDLHLLVESAQLLVQIFFLTKSSLEHLNFIS
jgi:hypothetical protein